MESLICLKDNSATFYIFDLNNSVKKVWPKGEWSDLIIIYPIKQRPIPYTKNIEHCTILSSACRKAAF